MRILYLHQYFTTPEHAGGVRSYQFAKRLVKRGVGVDMITSSAFLPIEKTEGERFISRRQIEGIDVHVIHTNYSNEMGFLRRIFAFLAFTFFSSIYVVKLKNRDLVYATSTPLTIGIPALVAKHFHRIPMAFEVRDMWPDVPIAMGVIKNKILSSFLIRFENFLYQSSQKVIGLSEGIIRELQNKQVPNKKLVLIPNASDIKEFEAANLALSSDPFKDLRNNNQTKICLYAGTFGLVNCIDYLVELASEIRSQDINIQIVLIGSGSQKQRIAKNVAKKKLGQVITLLDPIPKEKLIPYILASDACISTVQNIPALYNNSANKFFDALAAGRPIIINHTGWQAEIIENNNLGLVLDNEMHQNVSRLDHYLKTVDKNVLEKRIREFAGSHYSRDLLFERLYNEVISPSLTSTERTQKK